MSEIAFTIPLIPVAKQGDRSRIAGRPGKQFVQHYKSAKVQQGERDMAGMLREYVPPVPLEGPLSLEVEFRFPLLKDEKKPALDRGWIWKDTKPDYDNLAKQIGDVMERMCFFKNDSQICRATVLKKRHRSPGIRVVLSTMDYASVGTS